MSMGQKWAQFEKEYTPSDWASGTKIGLAGEVGGDLSVRKGILEYSKIWLSYNMLKTFHNKSLLPRLHRD